MKEIRQNTIFWVWGGESKFRFLSKLFYLVL